MAQTTGHYINGHITVCKMMTPPDVTDSGPSNKYFALTVRDE